MARVRDGRVKVSGAIVKGNAAASHLSLMIGLYDGSIDIANAGDAMESTAASSLPLEMTLLILHGDDH